MKLSNVTQKYKNTKQQQTKTITKIFFSTGEELRHGWRLSVDLKFFSELKFFLIRRRNNISKYFYNFTVL